MDERERQYLRELLKMPMPKKCPLCGDALRRGDQGPKRKVIEWQGSYAHQRCADKQSEREIGPWRSGGGRGWYIGSASDWKRRIKRK